MKTIEQAKSELEKQLKNRIFLNDEIINKSWQSYYDYIKEREIEFKTAAEILTYKTRKFDKNSTQFRDRRVLFINQIMPRLDLLGYGITVF